MISDDEVFVALVYARLFSGKELFTPSFEGFKRSRMAQAIIEAWDIAKKGGLNVSAK